MSPCRFEALRDGLQRGAAGHLEEHGLGLGGDGGEGLRQRVGAGSQQGGDCERGGEEQPRPGHAGSPCGALRARSR